MEYSRRGARPPRRGVSVVVVVLVALLAVAAGVGIGLLLYPHIPFPQSVASLAGKTTVGESDLSLPLGTYEYRGVKTSVSIREAIEQTSSVDAARNADGTYTVPSVDTVLAVARNRILLQAAQERGIAATDEDAMAYARDTFGTDDFATIAANYGMEVERAREQMRQSATLRLLRDAVVTTTAVEPAAPVAPQPGAENDYLPEYAPYVLGLVGDEWNAEANAWAREDGPYRERLRDYTISNEGATFAAAQAAYEEAMQQFALAQQQRSAEWTSYVNTLLADVHAELGTLIA